MTDKMVGRLGAALALTVTAIALVWRWHIAAGLEPRWDQAGHFMWLEATFDSQHFLPHGALEADDLSALHNLLRPLAALPLGLLLTSDWLISLPFLLFEGARYSALVQSSMVASALSVGIVVLAVMKRGEFVAPWARLAAGGIGGASLLLNAYSVHYSAFILHNYAVFLFLLCAVTLEDSMRVGGKRRYWAALAVCAALYAHWTILTLLPPAIGARLLFSRELTWRRRMTALIQVGAAFALALAPLIAAMSVLHAGNQLTAYADVGQYQSQPWLGPLLHRVGFWFSEAGELFSYPGLAAGIGGLVLLARRGCALPAWLLLTHFLLTAVMPGFTWNGSNTYLRTYLYAVPLLCVGSGVLALEIFAAWSFGGRHTVCAVLAVALLLGHFLPPFGQAVGMAELARRSPVYQADYMEGQGNLAATARAFLPLLPEGALVIPSGWGPRDLLFTVTDRPTRHYRFPFTLENTLDRAANGTLSDFFQRRGFNAALLDQPFFVMDVQRRSSEELAADLQRICGALPGAPNELAFDIQPVGQWRVGISQLDDVSLYRVSLRPPFS